MQNKPECVNTHCLATVRRRRCRRLTVVGGEVIEATEESTIHHNTVVASS